MKPARLASVLLSIVAILHVLRLMFQVEVTFGTVVIPLWASLPAAVLLSALAAWLWRDPHAPSVNTDLADAAPNPWRAWVPASLAARLTQPLVLRPFPSRLQPQAWQPEGAD